MNTTPTPLLFRSDAEARRAARTTFDARLQSRWPCLQRWRYPSQPSFLVPYATPRHGDTRVFVALLFGKYGPRFSLEVGWTTQDSFPSNGDTYWWGIRAPKGAYTPAPGDGRNVRFRLGELRVPCEDSWWDPVGPKHSNNVERAVQAALDEFATAVPFIEERSGISLAFQRHDRTDA